MEIMIWAYLPVPQRKPNFLVHSQSPMGNLLQRLLKESHYYIIREIFQTVRSYKHRIWGGEYFTC